MASASGNATRYVVGCEFGTPKPTWTQPSADSLRNDGIAVRSIGQLQSCRSVGMPFAATNAAKTAAAATAAAWPPREITPRASATPA